MGALLKTRRRGRHLIVRGTGYRLQFRLTTRVIWTLLLVMTAVFFVPVVVSGSFDFWWRTMAAVSVLCSLGGVRVLWGAAIVVGRDGMRVYRPWWPLHRDVAWYRILATDVIPGFWFLELEMNSGERIELPTVEHMDELYDEIEHHRARLDTLPD